MLSTVGHAGDVLDLFTAEHPEWGVTAAARQLGMPKSRAHDLLASLTAIGLLEHVPRGCYRLGWRSLVLASTQIRTSPLMLQAPPVMRAIADDHTATVLLFVWDRRSLLCVGREDPAQALPEGLPPVGARFRANGSAAAKVLLAHRSSREIAELGRESARSADGPGPAQSIEADLQRVRRRGYAAGRDAGPERTPAVAAPIRDARDDVVAAVSIAQPKLQSDADLTPYVDVIVGAAATISGALRDVQPTLQSGASDAAAGWPRRRTQERHHVPTSSRGAPQRAS
jgi:IclR family KDG regulon transcriptional repressor